mmetsp:Transcript_123397/g.308298  ORF Transcript_123397/g.308298 Transcript_123397/m.308298 type:complete len:230 (-) Transcript_123397:996-1685(-)
MESLEALCMAICRVLYNKANSPMHSPRRSIAIDSFSSTGLSVWTEARTVPNLPGNSTRTSPSAPVVTTSKTLPTSSLRRSPAKTRATLSPTKKGESMSMFWWPSDVDRNQSLMLVLPSPDLRRFMTLPGLTASSSEEDGLCTTIDLCGLDFSFADALLASDRSAVRASVPNLLLKFLPMEQSLRRTPMRNCCFLARRSWIVEVASRASTERCPEPPVVGINSKAPSATT